MTRIGGALGALLAVLVLQSPPLAAQPASGQTRSAPRAAPATRRAPPPAAPRRPVPASPAIAGAAIAAPAGAAAAVVAAEPEPPAPSDPAAAPPDPVRLDRPPRPPLVAVEEPPLPLPHGLEALSGGAWRVAFAPETDVLPEPAAAALAQIGRRLAARPSGRITVAAQASGPDVDVSAARRLALLRGLAVKAALAAGGLPPTRIDVRPLGRLNPPVDAVEVQPPEPRAAPGASGSAR